VIKNSDIYVLSGLLAHDEAWSYRSLAERLHVPHPVVQRALARAKGADLYSVDRREVHLPHFEEFALHALRFVAPARLGALTPGVPAAWAAEPMASAIRSSGNEPPPVWPYAHGRVRGQAVEPLHSAAPEAVENWSKLGEVLALLDSLRVGDARVRRVADDLLSGMLRERLLVTDRSRPVAELGPAPSTGPDLDRLIAEGRVSRPVRSGLPEPLELTGNPRALSRALDDIRGDR